LTFYLARNYTALYGICNRKRKTPIAKRRRITFSFLHQSCAPLLLHPRQLLCY